MCFSFEDFPEAIKKLGGLAEKMSLWKIHDSSADVGKSLFIFAWQHYVDWCFLFSGRENKRVSPVL